MKYEPNGGALCTQYSDAEMLQALQLWNNVH